MEEPIIESPTPETEAPAVETNSAISQDTEGTIKINLAELNSTTEDVAIEQEEVVEDVAVEQPEVTLVETVSEDNPEATEQPELVIEEITDEKVAETTEELEEEVTEAIEEQAQSGTPLPENLQKVVDFMEETNGTLEDYVRLNQDYSSLNDDQLLREYYEATKPHLEKEDIDFLMEDNFDYDEDIDDDRDIRRKKLARREELSKAKSHLEGLKGKYYEEIKGGSKLLPEQKEAVDFFNRYKEENKEANKIADLTNNIFLNKTNKVFNEDFKGFDYSVGDKKYRFNVKNPGEIKETQSNINNFVKKFLNDKNQMNDAKGYHKSLFTAMNADAVASHFYEQGKADAIKGSMQRSKNIDMDPRGTHEQVTTANGWKIRAVPSDASSANSFKIKKR